MLLTLAVNSLRTLVAPNGGERSIAPMDIPRYARQELGLHGLNIPTWLLSGWKASELEKLRDVADKAACPCLLLVDDEAIELGAAGATGRAAAGDRFTRLTTAANRLGCNSMAIACKGPATGSDECFDRTVAALKAAFATVDRLELNVLLRPCAGMLDDPSRLTELIKRVGGFRIGSLPDFGHARRSGSAEATLRKLAPYAGAIHATIEGFKADGSHLGSDLAACVEAIRSVGYQNTLAIEYVGKGDAVEGIIKARDILALAISGEEQDASVDEAESAPASGDGDTSPEGGQTDEGADEAEEKA